MGFDGLDGMVVVGVVPALVLVIAVAVRWGGRLAALLTAILMVAAGAWLLPRAASPAAPLSVLVAPFDESDGAPGIAGDQLASRLVAALRAGGVAARQAPAAPHDAATAQAWAVEQSVDLVVWGRLTGSGDDGLAHAMIMLAYRPVRPLPQTRRPALGWRLSQPLMVPLAPRPLPITLVLALCQGLADYQRGDDDAADGALAALLTDGQVAGSFVPHWIRAAIAWDRGDAAAALAEYRRIAPVDPQHDALVAGAVGEALVALQDPAAAAYLERMTAAFAAEDAGALRWAGGMAAWRAGDLMRAYADVRAAQQALAPSAELELVLSVLARDRGDVAAAAAALQRAALHAEGVPPGALDGLAAHLLQQRIAMASTLLDLARTIDAAGPLRQEWLAASATDTRLIPLWHALDGIVGAAADLARDAERHALGREAVAEPIAAAVATRLAAHARALGEESAGWRATVAILLAETPAGRTPWWAPVIDRPWSAARERERLLALVEPSADRDLRAAVLAQLAGDAAGAAASLAAAAAQAPDDPLLTVVRARLALGRGAVAEAGALLDALLVQSPDLAAAHAARGALARQQGDLVRARQAYEWLVLQRGDRRSVLALAEVLRLSGGADALGRARALAIGLADAGDPDAQIELGWIAIATGDPAASDWARRAGDQLGDGSHALQWWRLAQLDSALGRDDAARMAAEAVIARQPAHLAAHLMLAALAGPAEATGHYRAALAATRDATALLSLGDELARRGATDPALDAYGRALRVADAPMAAMLHRRRATALLTLGQIDAADQSAREAVRLAPDDAGRAAADVLLADIAVARGAFAEAIAGYRAVLARHPAARDALVGLAQAAAAQGDWPTALAELQRAHALDPAAAAVQQRLAEAWLETGEASAALEVLAPLLIAQPDDPAGWTLAARAALRRGDQAGAQAPPPRAIGLDRQAAAAWWVLGSVAAGQGDRSGAIEQFQQAIATPDRPANARWITEARVQRALLALDAGQWQLAQDDLERAARRAPQRADIAFWLGRVYLAQHQWRDARAMLQHAVARAGGSYPAAQLAQALAEERAGLVAEAIETYRAVVAQAPGTPGAADAAQALRRLGAP
jgi:predicted Zn-dependent protease